MWFQGLLDQDWPELEHHALVVVYKLSLICTLRAAIQEALARSCWGITLASTAMTAVVKDTDGLQAVITVLASVTLQQLLGESLLD